MTQRITEVITIHPEGDMKACTKFNGNPSYSYRDILTKSKRRHPPGGARGSQWNTEVIKQSIR